ncbi:hypothetical protein D3C80_1758620 [compost metagenome]
MLSFQVLDPARLLGQPLLSSGGIRIQFKDRSFHLVDDCLVDPGRAAVQHAAARLRVVQHGSQGLAQGQAQLDIVHQPGFQGGVRKGRGLVEHIVRG